MNEDEKKRFIVENNKRLLTICLENQGENMIALGPKCYTFWNKDVEKPENEKTKVKEVKEQQNLDVIKPM